jgi:uncharacterized membrane protein YeaQ/YmgE (transglycosylase-associated protein family)
LEFQESLRLFPLIDCHGPYLVSGFEPLSRAWRFTHFVGHFNRRSTMGIVYWAIFGLIAGAIAKYLMPGTQPGGIILTIILGVVGAVVGGYIGTLLGFGDVTGFNIKSMLLAVGGGVLVLFLFGLATKRR